MSNQANAAGSKIDLTMAQTEPISDSGRASGLGIYKEKSYYSGDNGARERRTEMREEQPYRHQGQSRRKGRSCSRNQSWDFPATCIEDHGEAAVLPLKAHGEREIHVQPMEDPVPEQVHAQRTLWCYGKTMLEQAPSRTYGLMDLWPHGGHRFWLLVPEGLHPLEMDPCWRSS